MDSSPTLFIAGTRFVPHVSGALWWPAQHALIVADLHFEKGSAIAARGGGFLPPYDTAATLTALETAVAAFGARRVVALGDSFHDGEGPARLAPADAARIRTLTDCLEWIWIAGNHDPEPPAELGGVVRSEWRRGDITLRHDPAPAPAHGEIAGHLHPCATVRVRGRSLRRRCFVSDGARAVLPAFGAYAGGLDLTDNAWAEIFPGDYHAWLLGGRGVYPIARARLAA